jgi:hypothetical protein
LCFQDSRMAKSRTRRARGAPVLPRQDDVKKCSELGRFLTSQSFFRSKLQHGQGFIEFAIVFGFIGIALSLIWSLISSLAADQGVSPVWWLMHVVYGGGLDWMWSGHMP